MPIRAWRGLTMEMFSWPSLEGYSPGVQSYPILVPQFVTVSSLKTLKMSNMIPSR